MQNTSSDLPAYLAPLLKLAEDPSTTFQELRNEVKAVGADRLAKHLVALELHLSRDGDVVERAIKAVCLREGQPSAKAYAIASLQTIVDPPTGPRRPFTDTEASAFLSRVLDAGLLAPYPALIYTVASYGWKDTASMLHSREGGSGYKPMAWKGLRGNGNVQTPMNLATILVNTVDPSAEDLTTIRQGFTPRGQSQMLLDRRILDKADDWLMGHFSASLTSERQSQDFYSVALDDVLRSSSPEPALAFLEQADRHVAQTGNEELTRLFLDFRVRTLCTHLTNSCRAETERWDAFTVDALMGSGRAREALETFLCASFERDPNPWHKETSFHALMTSHGALLQNAVNVHCAPVVDLYSKVYDGVQAVPGAQKPLVGWTVDNDSLDAKHASPLWLKHTLDALQRLGCDLNASEPRSGMNSLNVGTALHRLAMTASSAKYQASLPDLLAHGLDEHAENADGLTAEQWLASKVDSAVDLSDQLDTWQNITRAHRAQTSLRELLAHTLRP